uniref:Uncharacterized protein n=1 Tax=Salix viminalis TaxID=40686 RepID=A0A6N2MZD9_SALVM
MSAFLHQRPLYSTLSDPFPLSPRQSSSPPETNIPLRSHRPNSLAVPPPDSWRNFTLDRHALDFLINKTCLANKMATVHTIPGGVVCCKKQDVSQPYLPFLSNWLISISRQKHQDKVLVIAEDYATLYKVNEKWPGHAVLVPPAPDSQTAHKFSFPDDFDWFR